MLQTGKIVSVIFNDDNYVDKVELNLGDYEIIEEHGKTYAVKKKKEYPKTYEGCCDILQLEHTFELNDLTIEEETLFKSFIQLKRCRDAYWKIAGYEMGLGKPWEPDWEENSEKSIITKFRNAVAKFNTKEQYTFTFPTEEMRDAFYENFKEEIEICKELL